MSGAVSVPIVARAGNCFVLTWPVEGVEARIQRVSDDRDGIRAEVVVSALQDGEPILLHRARLNLHSTRSRQDLAKFLATRCQTVEALAWELMLEQVLHHVAEGLRAGEPVIELSSDVVYQPPKHLLKPLIQENKATLWFGDGGTGKSFLAMASCIILGAAARDNPLGLVPDTTPVRSLYLDWETDQDEAGWRFQRIARGLGLVGVRVLYRRMALPLAEDLEVILRTVSENNVGHVVVDSLSGACGGDLQANDVANKFFGSLRQLRVSPTLLTHIPKDQGDGRKATPYGSAFWKNWARNAWELRSFPGARRGELDMALYHRKSNSSELFDPVGLRMVFDTDAIRFARQQVRGVDRLAEGLPVKDRILDYLTREGKVHWSEIAEALGLDNGTVRSALSGLKKKGLVQNWEDGWGVLASRREAA